MRHTTAVIAAALVASACASTPKPLTAEENAVRSVTDASECEYLGSGKAMKAGSDSTLSRSAKIRTAERGGDSYQILHTRDGYSDLFGKTTEAEIEIYRCRD